jgi:hypothetical protein
MIRVIVQFNDSEVELIDRAVERLNRKPGQRATRSSVVRAGAVARAESVLAETPEAKEKEIA